MMVRRLILLGLVGLLAAAAMAQRPVPAVPTGPPTSGFAVGLVSEGVDYTQPGIAAKLARDGEGEIIGWSVTTRDHRPYQRNGAATHLVSLSQVLVAPIQIEPKSVVSWDGLFEFLARAPTRVVVIAEPLDDPIVRPQILRSMADLTSILFILPASTSEGAPRIDNVLSVAALPLAGQPKVLATHADLVLAPGTATREKPGPHDGAPRTAAEAAMLTAGLFRCRDLTAARAPADVKRLLLTRAQPGPASAPPLLAACD